MLNAEFESNVVAIPFSGCWLWTGNLSDKGYGQIQGRVVERYAHRITYKLYKGNIPDDKIVMHICDVPSCVNPAHLKLGTRADNNADRDTKGRHIKLRGEKHGGAKLKWENILEIRAATRDIKSLAVKFNVSISTIAQIRSNAIWRKPE